MLASVGPARFIPRSSEQSAERRRFAALRATVDDIQGAIESMRKEQDIQFKRIAQLQQDIDELKRLLRKQTAGQ
jgi:peptidoglycan hydrolase CwlO-like protein